MGFGDALRMAERGLGLLQDIDDGVDRIVVHLDAIACRLEELEVERRNQGCGGDCGCQSFALQGKTQGPMPLTPSPGQIQS